MFCPKCRYEYKPEISVCPDCNERLVPELPKEEEPEYVEFTKIFESLDHSAILLAKAILDEAEIHCLLRSNHGYANLSQPLVNPNDAQQLMSLEVPSDQAAKAKKLLEDLEA